MARIKIDDIAKRLRLSKSTVSKAINDRADVSLETKKRVKSLAEKLKYKPDKLARALVLKETKTIGLIIPRIEYTFFIDISLGVSDCLDERDYRVLLAWSQEEAEKEINLLEDLKLRRIDGVIIAPAISKLNLSYYEKCFREKYPVVIIDRYIPGIKAPFVGTDFTKGSYLATQRLIKLGHKRIGFIGPLNGTVAAKERLKGYSQALRKEGIRPRDKFIQDYPLNMEGGYEGTKKLIKHDLTAIFCANDLIAIGAMNYLKERGIKVPDEISLVGFGNLLETRNIEIPITTIDQKCYEIGKKASQVLLSLLNGKRGIKKKYLIKPTLVVRASTAKLKRN